MAPSDHTSSYLFIIFGATGDLTRRKLVPALYHLVQEHLNERLYILGTARSDWTDDRFREEVRQGLQDRGIHTEASDRWCDRRLFYQSLGPQGDDLKALKQRIEALEEAHELSGNRVFYLALPPDTYAPTTQALGEVGLNCSSGWTRLVIEKPFGHDLASAQELNRLVHQHFDENQIYRIDHYLGKETVQNLLVFRFANALFENAWNRDRIEKVEITVEEDLGVGTRAGYYDRTGGALRDMVQNHLTQLFSLIAMEAPSHFDADPIRREKIKVLETVEPIDPRRVVLGQYAAGTIDGTPVVSYRDEEGVTDASTTETFVEVPLHVSNWRWQGVPFILRTGKRLPRRRTQIAVHFRCAPISIFQPSGSSCGINPNVLMITLQPNEGFDLYFEVKRPGQPMQLATQKLRFRYQEAFGDGLPDAYETLLQDVLKGDQTLFVHADEVEASWRLYTPLLEADLPVQSYTAGSEGPMAAGTNGIGQDTVVSHVGTVT